MQKTYITTMPDKAGAFLKANQIIAGHGGNIVRVSYNKAVDLHTLFLDVEADKKQLQKITQDLGAIGYLANENKIPQRVMLVEVRLLDVPGALTPVLELLQRHHINISYLNAQQSGTPYQHIRMGLYIEEPAVMKQLLDDMSAICDVKILEYSVTEKILDSTVFYIEFANEMRDILGLDRRQTNQFIIESNRIMQMLDGKDQAPFKSFDYIRRFARFIAGHRGSNYQPIISQRRMSPQVMGYIVEPPCGSNTYLLDDGKELLCIDGGFRCFLPELQPILESMIPGFSTRKKTVALTHGDIDHTGLLPIADRVLLSENCYRNFVLEREGKADYREQNPLHAPYCCLSKIITGYTPPELDRMEIIGRKLDGKTLSHIGALDFADLHFEVYEGNGGHVRGETVYVDTENRLMFSGDNWVNIKGFSEDQMAFNKLAPYLMTSVNMDSKEATACRKQLQKWAKGMFVCPGHGMWFEAAAK